MGELSLEDRALAVLDALHAPAATRAASGRYRRSQPILPGVRYWSTSMQRFSRDYVGVQFFGEAVGEASRFEARLVGAGFERRTPQTGQITFAKPVPFASPSRVDVEAVRAVGREIADILVGHDSPRQPPGQTFRDFMLASPLAEVELEPPSRQASWRGGV